jgi:hypothetical protein
MRKKYRAPWDILLIIVTTLVIGLLLGIVYLIPSESYIPKILNFGIIVLCAGFGVFGYSIQQGVLRVHRLGWYKDISLSNIKSVEFKPNVMAGSLRTFGIGGVFGYIGHFRNRTLSNYKAYATHRKKTVVIQTNNNDQIVISPDDPELFVKSLHDAINNFKL